MLALKFTEGTELPLVGSTGYLRGTAQKCRVLRRNGDKTCLVQLFHRPRGFGEWEPILDSTGNRTVEEGDIYETQRLATFCGKPPKGRERKPRRRG